MDKLPPFWIESPCGAVETWHARLSLPAQALLPNLKIKCLQQEESCVCVCMCALCVSECVCVCGPKHGKSKGRCLDFKAASEHIQHACHLCLISILRERSITLKAMLSPYWLYWQEKKAYLNPSLPPLSSFLLLAMRCHLLSCGVEPWQKRMSDSIAQGYVLSQKELQYSQRERRGGGVEWSGGGRRVLTISPFWMKSDLHVSSFLSGSVSSREFWGVVHWTSSLNKIKG